MKKFKEILKYYMLFFKIGLFTIGGGYAMLPIIEKELVEKYKWSTEEEVLDSYALAQSIPGVIAVNTAALIGVKGKGFWGAVAASLGVISPSIIIIIMISTFFSRLREITIVENAFKGVRAAVLALLVISVYKMVRKSVKDIWGIIFLSVAFVCVLFFDVSPIFIIIGAVIVSIFIYNRKEKDEDAS
ncbi:chromate transporter [Vallitalea longa]|uniref:Chromate transporter n=1 Tax=Vallitalea longa TaxID=2936439 RepID=A0A9W5Y7Q8_9FIRM|nr:chromate transporter [Vallitalea longa]GKX27809.1 chromate transporter [Vallitalea longa]